MLLDAKTAKEVREALLSDAVARAVAGGFVADPNVTAAIELTERYARERPTGENALRAASDAMRRAASVWMAFGVVVGRAEVQGAKLAALAAETAGLAVMGLEKAAAMSAASRAKEVGPELGAAALQAFVSAVWPAASEASEASEGRP